MYYTLENGLKLVYKKGKSKITSICIGLEAGASCEKDKYLSGSAHAVEHMVYKATSTKTENEINKKLSDIFAFQNAMTNYPYVIFYGSLLEEDINEGLELLADIVMNPKLSDEGFDEELSVIKQELSEWDQDLEQYAEDKLFINTYSKRLKNPIIGTNESLEKMTIDDLRKFYNDFYFPGNTVVSIVSNLEFETVRRLLTRFFGKWESKKDIIINEEIEKLSGNYYTDYKDGITTSRVEIVFSLGNLSDEEIRNLIVFDEFFAKGVDSVLFDNLRTKRGLVYDVLSFVSYEKHIRLYKITFNTSEENIEEAMKCIKDILSNIDVYINKLDKDKINSLIKKIQMKKLFKEEQSIISAKNMAVHEIMFNNYELYDDINKNGNITRDAIYKTVNKIKNSFSCQMILPKSK